MPVIIGIILVLLVGFQLFFRYEQWPSKVHDGAVYEHDRLTGETHEMRPGEKVDILSRLFGGRHHRGEVSDTDTTQSDGTLAVVDDQSKSKTKKKRRIDPSDQPGSSSDGYQMNMVERGDSETPPIPVKKKVSQIPQRISPDEKKLEPAQAQLAAIPSVEPVTHKFDLDQDGMPEEIVESVTANDGLLDISVVKDGKEVFYGRGRQLQILPNRRNGWSEIALVTRDTHLKKVYSFDNKLEGYILSGKTPN